MERRTAPELWRDAVRDAPPDPRISRRWRTAGVPCSWDEAAERVDALANGLLARGVRHGDRVAVLSRTRLEWILLDWAVMSIGAVVVGLYPTSSAKECEYILEHCEAVLAFAEDDEQTRKLVSDPRLLAARCARSSRSTGSRSSRRTGAWREHLQPEPVAGGRPRDADLHLRHDRAAEGLHAHAPEPRHGGDTRVEGNPSAGRRDPALPAAGAQLRPARPPGGNASRSDGCARRRRRAACPRR